MEKSNIRTVQASSIKGLSRPLLSHNTLDSDLVHDSFVTCLMLHKQLGSLIVSKVPRPVVHYTFFASCSP